MPAGNLHAYLSGGGVEIMANSDNVMRGGLTPKYVNVDELLAIVDFTPGFAGLITPHRGVAGGVALSDAGAGVRAVAHRAGGEAVLVPAATGGRILLVTDGEVTADVAHCET